MVFKCGTRSRRSAGLSDCGYPGLAHRGETETVVVGCVSRAGFVLVSGGRGFVWCVCYARGLCLVKAVDRARMTGCCPGDGCEGCCGAVGGGGGECGFRGISGLGACGMEGRFCVSAYLLLFWL